jgi:hypothetical protein
MPSANITLTNPLPDSAGIKLVRSMGAEEDAVSWDVDSQGPGYDMAQNPKYRFVYAGQDSSFFAANPLSLSGTGSNATDFVWSDDKAFTAGFVNDAQTLIPWGSETNAPAYSGTVEIGTFSIDTTKITMTVNIDTNDVTLTPWYTTNLLSGSWSPGVNAGQSLVSGTTYRVWCDLVSDAPGAFYKVRAE